MKVKIFMLVFLTAALFTACSKRIATRRYYVLELTNTTLTKPDSTSFDIKVDVRDFRVARAFDQTRIALRTNSNELDYYFYHHWAAKPSLSVADFVYDFIEGTNIFTGRFRGISYNPDYLITGDIKSLERIQEHKAAYAHVHMVIELINAETEQVVVRYEDNQQVPVEPAKSMNTFARVTSQILKHFADEFLDQVQLFLEENRPQGRQ
ncbi:membrane integrity-associated transporter subunit PqiC [candidate division KSB1 bacterium]|nr:membrane integrity-associated transporter subunit PqiC [candidate division KSB1 bacterium]